MFNKSFSEGLELRIRFSKLTSKQLELLHRFIDGETVYITGIDKGTNVERVTTTQGASSPQKEEKLGQAYEGVELLIKDSVSIERFFNIANVMYASLLGPGYSHDEVKKNIDDFLKKYKF